MNSNPKTGSYKRKALRIVFVVAVLLVALILLRACSGGKSVSTVEGRQAFLQDLGWEIDLESEDVRTVQFPDKLDGMLAEYNALQQTQGYDLSPYLGGTCQQYSYRVLNHPDQSQTVLATLYVQGDKIIAGDIHSTAMNGFLQGLKKE